MDRIANLNLFRIYQNTHKKFHQNRSSLLGGVQWHTHAQKKCIYKDIYIYMKIGTFVETLLMNKHLKIFTYADELHKLPSFWRRLKKKSTCFCSISKFYIRHTTEKLIFIIHNNNIKSSVTNYEFIFHWCRIQLIFNY